MSTRCHHATNSDAQVVIGEVVTYALTTTVPEGQTPAAQIVDTLDAGLAFVDVVSVTNGSGLTIATPPGTGTSPANVTVTNSGRTLTFGLGTITNPDTNNASAETFTIRYRAVVTNEASNQSSPATNLNNAAQLTWTGGSITAVGAPTVAVREPQLSVTKTASLNASMKARS